MVDVCAPLSFVIQESGCATTTNYTPFLLYLLILVVWKIRTRADSISCRSFMNIVLLVECIRQCGISNTKFPGLLCFWRESGL